MSELAKLIEQLVTAERGGLPPAFFPLLAGMTTWYFNIAIKKKKNPAEKTSFLQTCGDELHREGIA